MNYTERNKLIDALCGVGLMLLLVEVFYGIVDSAYTLYGHRISNVTLAVQITGAVFLGVSIYLFLRAYKKDDMALTVYGIEFLVIAILSALLPGAYISFPKPYSTILSKGFPFMFLAYYLIKAIVILIKTFKKKKGNR